MPDNPLRPLLAGCVTQQIIIDTSLSNRFAIRHINFDKGARNKFHAHSIEQILIITEVNRKPPSSKTNSTDLVFGCIGDEETKSL